MSPLWLKVRFYRMMSTLIIVVLESDNVPNDIACTSESLRTESDYVQQN